MKTNYPIEIKDLRHQSDHVIAKKIQAFKEDGTNPHIAWLFLILIRRREIEFISDGKKLLEVKDI